MDTKSVKVTVCLKNVPVLLKAEGIKNLFSDIGTCFVKFHKTGLNYLAFVIFDNLECAELAIRKINENKIFNMSAEYGRFNKLPPPQLSNKIKRSEDDLKNRSIHSLNNGNQLDDHQIKLFSTPVNIEKHLYSSNNLVNDCAENATKKYDKSRTTSNKYKNRGAPIEKAPSKMLESKNCNTEKQEYQYKTSESLNENEIIIGNCNRCNKIADKRCERCFDYYCSVECQKLDWHKHRFVCFELPKLIECPKKPAPEKVTVVQEKKIIEKTKPSSVNVDIVSNHIKSNKILSNNVELEQKQTIEVSSKDYIPFEKFPSKNSLVMITSFESLNKVYIRSAEKIQDEKFSLLLQDIYEYATITQPFSIKPEIGDLVLATSSNGKKYRAVIEQILHCGYFLCFIDYGSRMILPFHYVSQLSNDLKLRKLYTFKVNLENIDNTMKLNEKAKNYIENAITNNIKFKINYDDSKNDNEKAVELLHINSKYKFNQQLNEWLTIKVPALNDLPIFNKVQKMPLPIDENNIILKILNNCQIKENTISCIDVKNMPKLIELTEKLKEYCLKTQEIYLPRPNELCLVNVKDSWYRGCCIETSGDKHPSIFLIDFGNVSRVNINCIRKIPKELAEIPCMTHSCIISDLPNHKTEMILEKMTKIFETNEHIMVDSIECFDAVSSDGDDKIYMLHIANIDTLFKS